MKKILLSIFLLICLFQLNAQKKNALHDLIDPRYLIAENGKIFISDYPYVYIYSLEDFSLIKKIGGAGEGPGEFYIPKENMNLKERGMTISLSPEYLVVSSVGRVSFFTKNGKFLKFTKVLPYNMNAKLLYMHGKLLGFFPTVKGKLTLSLSGLNMKNQKKLLESSYWFNLGSKEMYNFFDRACDTLLVTGLDGKIFIARGDSPDLVIDVYDLEGKKQSIITHNIKKTDIPKSFVTRIHQHFRLKFRRKSSGYFIENLNLPRFFPAVRHMSASDRKLYVITFNRKEGQNEVLVFSTDGNFLKSVYLPIKERNPEQLFPFSISKNTFYQVIEDEKTDTWELFVTPFN